MSARRTCAALLVGVVTLGACAAPQVSAPVAPLASSAASSSTPTSSTAGASPGPATTAAPDAQTAMDRLFAAGVAGDRTVWDAGTASLDATFAARSAMLFDNLRTLAPSRLQVRLTGAEQPVAPARQARLGPGARVVQATIGWRLGGERADATSSVWLTLVPGPTGERLAGTDDGARLDTPAVPLWWLAPTTRTTRGNVTVLAGAGQQGTRWATLAERAAADTRSHLPAALRKAWDGHLVVVVPGSEADFARVLGASPAAYATTAAVTRPDGPTTGAAVRVVVNPATAGDPDAELGTTLVHETVHVATRSAGSAAPLWAVEGLAEYVALEAHPDQRDDELALLRAGDPPARLPGDAAFTAGGKDVTVAYAEAWLACKAVAEHRGRDDLGRLYLALDDGRPLDAATSSTLGVGDATVVGWWQDALRSAVTHRG